MYSRFLQFSIQIENERKKETLIFFRLLKFPSNLLATKQLEKGHKTNKSPGQ